MSLSGLCGPAAGGVADAIIIGNSGNATRVGLNGARVSWGGPITVQRIGEFSGYECSEQFVIASGPTLSAAWARFHLLFFIRRLRYPFPRFAANRAFGSYFERVAGRFLVSGRAVVAQAETRRYYGMDRLLAFHL